MTFLQRLGDAVLTTDHHQRIRLGQSALASLLMVTAVAVMHTLAIHRVAQREWLTLWTAFALGGVVGVFLLIRSGWSLRFADPSLTLAQMVYAITCSAAAYLLAGAGAGVTLGVLAVVLNFGMFGLTTRQIVGVALYALLCFGAVIGGQQLWQAGPPPAGLAIGHFMTVVVEVTGVSFLTGRLERMRSRLRRQKLELQHAMERINLMVTRDELTGLVNRRHMSELMQQERHRCERSGRGFSLALLDIDHFKHINDEHGHAVGDMALRVFAQATVPVLRASDTLARWGGDEFVLMLPDTPPEIGQRCLERLREAVALMPVHTQEGDLRMTVSVGLTRRRAGETAEQTLERADRALYAAKAQGRNCVVVG